MSPIYNSKLKISDFEKISKSKKQLIALKDVPVNIKTGSHSTDQLQKNFIDKLLTPREYVETAFITLKIPAYYQIELEADNTRFMRELTQNYNELKQINRDAMEPTEYSYPYQNLGPTLSDDEGLLSFSFSQGAHVKYAGTDL